MSGDVNYIETSNSVVYNMKSALYHMERALYNIPKKAKYKKKSNTKKAKQKKGQI